MYPNLLPLIFFSIAAAFTPGPNNIVGSYSGFNFGIKKSLPLILGVTFGYTALITLSAAGLNVIFNTYPILKTIIKIIGVCNFPKKNIAGVVSEFLILGAIEKDGKVVLLHPSQKVENGLEIA